MTSNEQFAANQANSQLSTGPRTEEGKTRSSQNSLKHGVFAKTIVLPGESQEEFDTLLAGLHKDHSPVGETESNLVRGLAEIQWRLNRLRRYEAAATDEAFETGNFESKAILNCTLIEQRSSAPSRPPSSSSRTPRPRASPNANTTSASPANSANSINPNKLTGRRSAMGSFFRFAKSTTESTSESASKWPPRPSNTASALT